MAVGVPGLAMRAGHWRRRPAAVLMRMGHALRRLQRERGLALPRPVAANSIKALDDCDDATAEGLRAFLGAFGTHPGAEARDGLQRALARPDFLARDRRYERLGTADMAALRPTIEGSFKQLFAVRGVGGTIATKVLAVLNPDFFVMRDGPISLAYF